MAKIDIIIAEDHPLTRQTLAYQIKKVDTFNFLGAFENGAQAVEFTKTTKPDIILMDIDMPVMTGIEAVEEIKKITSKTKIIMLTNFKDRINVLNAFNSGANGYCVKNIKIDELIKVINIIYEGGMWVDSQIARFIFDVLGHLQQPQKEERYTPEDFDISEREKDVLREIADGLSNDEIAQKLFISRNTVKNHVASIIEKLSVKDRTQAAIFALKNKLFD
ncbi:MAG: response regulator transcription factor [Candidatus Gastranaerophilales bacterium]|nr:response regulator transcription factor [Candidatus Gastranaerophilales bacterium]